MITLNSPLLLQSRQLPSMLLLIGLGLVIQIAEMVLQVTGLTASCLRFVLVGSRAPFCFVIHLMVSLANSFWRCSGYLVWVLFLRSLSEDNRGTFSASHLLYILRKLQPSNPVEEWSDFSCSSVSRSGASWDICRCSLLSFSRLDPMPDTQEQDSVFS